MKFCEFGRKIAIASLLLINLSSAMVVQGAEKQPEISAEEQRTLEIERIIDRIGAVQMIADEAAAAGNNELLDEAQVELEALRLVLQALEQQSVGS
ncbi:MAG TPA: hypothetical protein VJJ81_00955 [Candidatus Babeliales bacterium]|nr:hypothetical protein [Candidatus Babeliales bacterium]